MFIQEVLWTKRRYRRGIDKILKEKPDVILFTGDLVNDRAIEMDDYKDVFSQLKAPMGVYSTLGNHDYGDYVRWESKAVKEANLNQLKKCHKQLGWRLLMNENIIIERGGEKNCSAWHRELECKRQFSKIRSNERCLWEQKIYLSKY